MASDRQRVGRSRTQKQRLDVLLVERGLAETRQRAQGLIMAGVVCVNGQPVTKPGTAVDLTADIELTSSPLEYVSRGALKLEAALERFNITVAGKVALDVGASTGGFTEVLLRRGAARVYAVDVGYGQLAWRLRQDQRVVVMERTNIRSVKSLPEPIELATIDVSFISLRLVLPSVARLMVAGGDAVPLIKPQFEAGREQVGKGGVVRDPAIHRAVLKRVLSEATESGWVVANLMASPLIGPAGNREFLAHLRLGAGQSANIEELIDAVVEARL
jgi:23S rRNA (cytidine1920-2'-O)/16S rRNA (cytidine1409-2'-O)-methyltransferase